MADDNLKQIINLPSELLDAIGKLGDAKRALANETKDIKKAIKDAEKAGQDTSKLRGRLENLSAKKEDLTNRIAINRANEIAIAKEGISARVTSFRSSAGEVARYAKGGIGFGDIANIGELASRYGSKLLGSERTQQIGSAVSRFGAGASKFVSTYAGLAAGAIAGALVIKNELQGEYRNRKIAAEGTAEIQTRLMGAFRRSARGDSSITIDKINEMNTIVNSQSAMSMKAYRDASPIERIRQALGFTAASAALGVETKMQQLGLDIHEFEGQFGRGSVGEMGAPQLQQAMRRKLRQKSWVYSGLEGFKYINFYAYAVAKATGYELSDIYTGLGFGAVEEMESNAEYQQKQINTKKEMIKQERDKYETDKSTDLTRLFDRDRKRHVRLYERDVRQRNQFWGVK